MPCSRRYAGLPGAQQQAVFGPTPRGWRKVVAATNVAETSLTIEGVVYVVDSCYVKQRAFNPVLGLESLLVAPTSKVGHGSLALGWWRCMLVKGCCGMCICVCRSSEGLGAVQRLLQGLQLTQRTAQVLPRACSASMHACMCVRRALAPEWVPKRTRRRGSTCLMGRLYDCPPTGGVLCIPPAGVLRAARRPCGPGAARARLPPVHRGGLRVSATGGGAPSRSWTDVQTATCCCDLSLLRDLALLYGLSHLTLCCWNRRLKGAGAVAEDDPGVQEHNSCLWQSWWPATGDTLAL